MRFPSPVPIVKWSLAGAVLLMLCTLPLRGVAQQATVTESLQTFRTYPFSDPDPVARMGNIYPYSRFQGFSHGSVDRRWRIVTLENPWIRVLVAPEIGGKVLGAIEKSTGKAFIYYNRVIKFREIAMRGPWTSGGIEFNFGDLGHTPATATPVDYLTRTNPDGSVSCVVGALDLPSRTEWRVEIRLPRDKALFETRSFWYNPEPVSTSRYHWMNAAVDADSTLQMIYPGNAHIGHAGEVGEWPVDREGRDLSWYRNNAFGSSKSYHVLGSYTDYFGARWNDFGMIHWSRFTDKPGKKLWIWSLAREGEIWTDLLTDPELGNTQYVELQSGLHFNQAVMQSSLTPFKHMAFFPHTSERFTEAWYPFLGLDGVVQASPEGVIDVKRVGGRLRFGFCPTGAFNGRVTVVADGATLYDRAVALRPLESFRDSIAWSGNTAGFEIRAGDVLTYRSAEETLRSLERPIRQQTPFDWNTAHGCVVDARERVRQRDLEGALASYRAALALEPAHLPALSGAAELYIRKLDFDSALSCARAGLAIDAYDPESNYFYGLIQRRRGRRFDARDGFGVASRSTSPYRTAALMQLAEMAFLDRDWSEAAGFARRASETDATHLSSLQLLAVLARISGDTAAAAGYVSRMLDLDPLSHAARYERFRLFPTEETRTAFAGMIRNELPHESFLELASFYVRMQLYDDARLLLSLAPRHPMVEFWQSYSAAMAGREDESRTHLNQAVGGDPALVFPYRREEWDILQWAGSRVKSWKVDYYLALLAWSLGRVRDAGTHFAACGDAPDFAPFYLTRAAFLQHSPERARADLMKAVAVGPGEWRSYNALASFLNARGEYTEALEVSSKGIERFPNSYVLMFLHARTLAFNGQYGRSLGILDTLRILPFEGARLGREVHRQVCVLASLQAWRGNDADGALALLQKARLWPERLGVGRPFDVDDRLEDYLASRVMRKKGDRKAADRLLGTVNASTAALKTAGTPLHLIGALALREAGRGTEARELLVGWTTREPGNTIARWALALFDGRRADAEGLLDAMRSTTLNRFTGDLEPVLVTDVVAALGP